MKLKPILALMLVLCLLATLAGCADSGTAVYVQSVRTLTGFGGIAPGDRFPGMVVSENVTKIEKDSDKTVAELLVSVGDDVEEGQALFSYDTEELQLNLDKQKLELEQLEATIVNYTQQIADLEEDREYAWGSDELQYTIQIQTLQVQLKETEISVSAKKEEIAKSEDIMENATVFSPISGRVQAISENGMDNYGNPLPYITIQQAGSYRVQGTIGELQLGVIMEGTRMKILSRTTDQVWYGTVALIDYENASQGSSYDMYYGMGTDTMTSSSKYPFYIELDDTNGLLLGLHVYLEVDTGEEIPTGLQLDASFISYEEDGSAYVWAEADGKLEKRPVTLGAFNDMFYTYEILEGLTENDYIAFPDPALCVVGAPTTHELVVSQDPSVAEGGVG